MAMLAVARTLSLLGIEAEPVHVEVDLGRGLPAFTVVGLPDTTVRESRERVRSAISNSGFDFPMRRVTASLAPADLKKAGPGFDLAIAAAVLSASGQLSQATLDRWALVGELALDGSVRSVPGVLSMALRAREWGMRGIAVPKDDAQAAAAVSGIEVVALRSLGALTHLSDGSLEAVVPDEVPAPGPEASDGSPDLADLRGQPVLRRALEIAAAGGHSVLLVGPPGAGKTLAARCLPSLMPAPDADEALEIARIAGACGDASLGVPVRRPFRAPHHTASPAALVGGGATLRPGEATRAHGGILFLDELGEFRRDALEALREPLEQRKVRLTRASGSAELPCGFLLVAASNPCPCGRGEDSGECRCHPVAAARYRSKLSGALADRIDMSIRVDTPSAQALADGPGEGSDPVRARVEAAREAQAQRQGRETVNALLSPEALRDAAALTEEAAAMLRSGHERLGLSGRGWERVLKVSRTIADLRGSGEVVVDDVAEALTLRRRDVG